MRVRLLTALVATAALAAPASGAMRPLNQVVDPKGDAKANLGFADIVTGLWTTTGSGANRALVGTLTLAGAVRTEPGFTYEMSAEVEGCGRVEFAYTPTSVSGTQLGQKSFYIGCGAPDDPLGTMSLYDEVALNVHGRAITWTVPLRALPREVGPGSLYTTFEALADVAEPFFGTPVLGMPGHSVDMGYGNASWRMR